MNSLINSLVCLPPPSELEMNLYQNAMTSRWVPLLKSTSMMTWSHSPSRSHLTNFTWAKSNKTFKVGKLMRAWWIEYWDRIIVLHRNYWIEIRHCWMGGKKKRRRKVNTYFDLKAAIHWNTFVNYKEGESLNNAVSLCSSHQYKVFKYTNSHMVHLFWKSLVDLCYTGIKLAFPTITKQQFFV